MSNDTILSEIQTDVNSHIESLLAETDLMHLDTTIQQHSNEIHSESTIFSDNYEILIMCRLPSCLYNAKYKEHINMAVDEVLKCHHIYTLDKLHFETNNVKVVKNLLG